MKNYFCISLVFVTLFTAFRPSTSHGEVPVKARAFLMMAGYGAAGGALLGAATMAFGTSSKNVFRGASLGLYAGIIFGTYVLVSHHQKRYGTYDDSSSPYQNSNDIYGDEYEGGDGGFDGGSGGGFFARLENIEEKFGEKGRGGSFPPLRVNLINYHF